ncbi:MAG TPA: hypothetical protein ENH01_11985 [Nitrospirae bacterium]|nr:hypothetical protein [Nitrospirota bacterium]
MNVRNACIYYGYRRRRWRHLDSCQFKTIIKCDVLKWTPCQD